MVDFMGTGKISEGQARKIVSEVFDLRPAAIIEQLDLLRPIFRKTAAYGHFGRPPAGELFSWERVDRAENLQREANRA